MTKIHALLKEYAESHQHAGNKLIHWICVPAIFFSIIGLLWSIPSEGLKPSQPEGYTGYYNWATVALLFALLYYLALSSALFVGMAAFSILCLMGNHYLATHLQTPLWQVSLSIFVLAWIGQFIGHKMEGKKPSFLKDIQFLLIGPAWLLSFIYKKLKIPY